METASFARPGQCASHLLAIFAVAGIAHGALAGPASAQGDSWSPLEPMREPRRLLAAAAEGDAIYTFGGCGSPCFDPLVHTSTFEETRLEVFEAGSWSVRKPIPAILFGAAAAAPGNGRIYVFGGFVTAGDTYEYNPQPDAWSRKAPMPTPRHGLAAVALEGKVYAIGGSDGSAATGALEVYDPALNSWSQKAPMPTPRVFLAAAAVKGRIYAIGGSPDCCGKGVTDVVEVYDPATDSWSRAAPLPVALQVSAAAALNGRIYVFGGFIPGEGVQRSTFEYDPATNTWRSLKPMLEPRDQAPAVVVGNVAHVIGGSVDCHCRARDTHDGYNPPKQLEADLAIEKINDPQGPVSAGDTLKYTIAVTNLGPAAVSGATVMDDLPATGLRDVKWCRDAGCTPSIPGKLSDTIALAPKESRIYEAMGTVAANATGTVKNIAEVVPPDSPGDPVSGNNVSRVTNPIVPVGPCHFSIVKIVNPSVAAPGDEIQYSIIVVREDCPTAVSATVTDDLAATGLIDARWCRGQGCTPSNAGNLVDTVALPADGVVFYTATGKVPCICGKNQIDNTACVAVSGQPERCDTKTALLLPAPGGGLALAIAGPGNLADCGAPSYTYTVTNQGENAACGAVLQVQPPAGSALASISSPCTGPTCALGDLAPGAQVQVTATFTAPAGLRCPTSFSTGALVTACDSAASTFQTRVPCDLAVTKTDGLTTAAPGDPILYTIGIANRGCAAVSGAGVSDAFPAELQKVRWCRGAACVPASSGNLVDTLDLPAGGTETYLAAGTVSPMFTGILRNTVTVSPPAGPPVSATDETTIAPAPGLTALCKKVSGSPAEGGVITKTFVIWNGGPAVQQDNPGPEFVDALPAGLTLISAAASSGTVTTAANTVSWNGSLQAGDMVTIEIMASVDAGTLGMTLCNGGTTHFDADGDGVNESSRATPVPCCITVQPVPPVPALSGPGLAALAALLALLALLRLRRREL